MYIIILFADNGDYNVPNPFEVVFTSLAPPMRTSDLLTISATMDNLFEDTERLQVMITDFSSPYVMCTECTADITFGQNPADSE